MYDLVIRNARIVDGTGRIVAVGAVTGPGAREIDAGGNLLTPGWVDVHSHMDGQATWDPLCSPAANHGITTLVMGNCGIGFAPCEPTAEARDRLIAVVEDVEDIPGAALHEGVKWTWESFPEYLEAVEKFPRAIDVGAQVPHCAVRTYVMGERGTNYEPAPGDSIAARAAASGVSPQQYCYDLMMKNDGRNVVYFPCFGYGANDLSRQVALIEDESTVLSLADTGAHCGVLCDASVPTQMLSYYVRDRQRGHRFALEQVVKMQTRDTARCVGLEDRGSLEVGMKADLNIIDFDALQLEAPGIVFDLPAGVRRMFQGARGYLATIVAGEVIMEDGNYTGAVPGKLIRGSQCAPVLAHG